MEDFSTGINVLFILIIISLMLLLLFFFSDTISSLLIDENEDIVKTNVLEEQDEGNKEYQLIIE